VDETKTKNKLKKRREKPSPREPCKSELISWTCNLLNYRLGIN
jgi:hypothetical protein